MPIAVTAYFPFQLPSPREGLDRLASGSLRQLLSLSGEIVLSSRNPVPIGIRKLSSRESRARLKAYHKSGFYSLSVFFEFSCQIDPESYRMLPAPAALKAYERPLIRHVEIAEEITYLVHQLVVASNIARPGSINVDTGYIFYDGDYDRTLFGLMSNLNLLFAFGHTVNWPRLKMLPVSKVWSWISEVEDFGTGMGRTPLGRCLAAFSHLFVNDYRQDSPVEDLWSIIGLEAVFQSNGSRRELTNRTRLFIGEQPDRRDWVDDLYKSRSTLVHGGGVLPFSFGDSGLRDVVEANREKRKIAMDRSISFLLATLQKMCVLGIHEIVFETRIVKSRRTTPQSQRLRRR
jgi:hypothetical protein